MMISVPYLAGAMLAWSPLLKSPFLIIAMFSLLWSALFGWRFYRTVQSRSNYQLGYDGERYVGEELSRLLVEDFEVYHDEHVVDVKAIELHVVLDFEVFH